MSADFLPYGRQVIDDEDVAAVAAVLRGDWLTTGPSVEAFEVAFAERVQARHAVACSSGTAGLHLLALAQGLGPGDMVVVPTVTFLATANAARYVGADVVFADVDPETGLMDAPRFLEAVDRAPKGSVKAVFPVHLNGHCVDMPALRAAAEGLFVAEDACHALGGDQASRTGAMVPVGACASSDAAMFSTHPVKAIATGEGGVLTTNDDALAERLRRFRNHGMVRESADFRNHDMAFEDGDGVAAPWYYEMHEPGFNYRLNDLQCALGISQLRRLSGFVEKRRKLRDRYAVLLDGLGAHVRAVTVASGCDPAWHLSVALIDFAALGTTRSRVMRQLRDRSIGTQVHYIPVHLQPYYRDLYETPALPGAERYYERCLSLPLFPTMVESDVDRVVEALAEVLGLRGGASITGMKS
ncbi:MAG: UDP-4-amino-4,6-dideoxy-N-acetyl-beta-L-altrosamine transaminase [Alphaproteobacteria bacterium]|jgi:UDP-4-amino-4,6-dideoxy-N-acetyl-beta-L-altrosamine transaminase|nr:UDP-4-amino-4,6-dideoxy-N-acetyl-beta-L-altrosamine transaminase [Alphaproteobacteria bacterium]